VSGLQIPASFCYDADMPAPTPTRCFRPTPAWLIYGLLVVEGLLWLSERNSWFAFNTHKGWTVLIAVASVGVTMLVLLAWFVVSLILRWQFQFSIRSLLVLTVAVAIPSSCLAVKLRQATQQRAAIAAIEKLGGMRESAADRAERAILRRAPSLILLPGYFVEPSGPAWLRRLVGGELFETVPAVDLQITELTDDGLEHLKFLDGLQELNLDSTEITDAGLETLEGLNQLHNLDLYGTRVTDAGVAKLQKALPNCIIRH
jgi:hypothetical protein